MGNGINVYEASWEQLTRDQAFEGYVPEQVCISLCQEGCDGCLPTVLPGEFVSKGQVIGKANTSEVPCVHASISGYIKEIFEYQRAPGVFETFIQISKDDAHKQEGYPFSMELDRESMIKTLAQVGISKHRLSFAKYLIINGFANEPYITSGYRLMLESPGKLIVGAILAAVMTEAEYIYICVNEDAFEAVARLKRAIKKYGKNMGNKRPIEIFLMKRRYPQGNEKIIKNIVMRNKKDSACVVTIAEIAALYDGIYDGEPWTRVGITVSGNVKNPKNLWVPIGTKVKDVIDYCGGMAEDAVVVHGGPFEGHTIQPEKFWVRRDTSGLLVLQLPDLLVSSCIHCGMCHDVCPKHLWPDEIEKKYLAGGEVSEKLRAKECIQCGLCSYICPSGRRLTEYIGQVKKGRVRKVSSSKIKKGDYIDLSFNKWIKNSFHALEHKSQSSPHIHRRGTIHDVMRNGIYGLIPLIFGVLMQNPDKGLHILAMLIVGTVSAGLTEYFWQEYMGHFQTIRDGSAIFNGFLLTLLCSVETPLWKIGAMSVTAILIGKQIFGGIGYSPIHPVIVGKLLFQPFEMPMIEALWLLAMVAVLWMCFQKMLPYEYPLLFIALIGVGNVNLLLSGTIYLAAAYFIWSYETMVPTRYGRWMFTVFSAILTLFFSKIGMGSFGVFFAIAFADLTIPLLTFRNVKRV